MAHPDARHAEDLVREFVDMVSVKPTGEDVFMSDLPNWEGGRVFGGLILGQTMHAAASTIGDDRRVHSIHGYFLRPAVSGRPLEFRVDRLRDGRSLSTRRVSTCQDGKEVFSMTASFAVEGTGRGYQLSLGPDIPDPDSIKERYSFDAVEIADVGETPPGPDGFHQSTGRMWFRLVGPMPDDPPIQAAMLAYFSDMTRTSARPPSLGKTDNIEGLISLDHAVWFHRSIRADDWLFFDIHVVVHAEGRGLMRGTIHTRDGRLGLSMAQEMMILPLQV